MNLKNPLVASYDIPGERQWCYSNPAPQGARHNVGHQSTCILVRHKVGHQSTCILVMTQCRSPVYMYISKTQSRSPVYMYISNDTM